MHINLAILSVFNELLETGLLRPSALISRPLDEVVHLAPLVCGASGDEQAGESADVALRCFGVTTACSGQLCSRVSSVAAQFTDRTCSGSS